MIPNRLKNHFKLPVIVAPMFLVSGIELVVASSKNGLLGTFPALNARTTEDFEQWLITIKEKLGDLPYGVNLIVHKSNPRLKADLEICAKHKVPLVITSLGAVKDVVDTVHSYGGLVFHDVTNVYHAKKAADAGVDGLIAVCAGAGGHAGTMSPFALLSDIKDMFQGTIILAGSLSKGEHIAAAQMLGADLCYMGTRFIPTDESQAQPEYKSMIEEAQAMDIIHTPAVSGVPANFMAQSLVKNGFDLNKLRERGDVDFGDKLTLNDEAKAWKNIWSAGHGVGQIHKTTSTKKVIDELWEQYSLALKNFKQGQAN